MHGYKFNFSENLVIINNLQNLGFKGWVFYSGMLFKSKPIWWEKVGKRKHLHEGLDIYFFRNENSEIRRIDSRFKIPVFYTGEVMRIIDDFLGETIFARHGICKDKKRLYSMNNSKLIDLIDPLQFLDNYTIVKDPSG